jgi:hypothetical protein
VLKITQSAGKVSPFCNFITSPTVSDAAGVSIVMQSYPLETFLVIAPFTFLSLWYLLKSAISSKSIPSRIEKKTGAHDAQGEFV